MRMGQTAKKASLRTVNNLVNVELGGSEGLIKGAAEVKGAAEALEEVSWIRDSDGEERQCLCIRRTNLFSSSRIKCLQHFSPLMVSPTINQLGNSELSSHG